MPVNLYLLGRQICLEKHLQLKNRHFLAEDLQKFFESTVDFAYHGFTKDFQPSDLPLFRARVHKPLNLDSYVPHLNRLPKPPVYEEKDIAAPPNHLAKAGRLNPPGLSYLYAANDPATAIAETRPSVGSYVTVARFELNRQIKVVDCRIWNGTDEIAAKKDKTAEEEYLVFWQNTICVNFTIPFHPEDISPYVPSQYYASAIKAKGDVDGILYNSAMHPEGFNICMFNPVLAQCVERQQKLIDSIRYMFISASKEDDGST